MRKLESLNYLRVFAILAIIIGHICLRLGLEGTGRYCGYVFVDVFFLLSALLLGLKYGDNKLGGTFLLKRYARLSCTYYPFLIISIVALLCLGNRVTFLNIISHFTYTNYIIQDSILGTSFGHLWFMSLIMMCYVLITILSRWKYSRKIFQMPLLAAAILLCICCGYVCELHHMPNRIVLVLGFFCFVFFNAHTILSWAKAINLPKSIIISILTNVLVLFLFNINIIGDGNRLIRDWCVLIAALAWFPLFCKIGNKRNQVSNIIDFLSSISFEMYLVHHPFVLGKYSVFNHTDIVGGGYFSSLQSQSYWDIHFTGCQNRLAKE